MLYFVGCYASFDKRNIAVAKSFVKLCQAAGVKVGILGKEEKCCGEPMRKMGNEYLYQTLAMETVETHQGVWRQQRSSPPVRTASTPWPRITATLILLSRSCPMPFFSSN